MTFKDPNASNSRGSSRGSSRGRGERLSDEEQTAKMKKFLTGLSYVIPGGLALNALRIAYRAAKAGRTAVGLVRGKNATNAKLLTTGEKAKNVTHSVDKVKLARDVAAKRVKINVGGAVATGGLAAGLNSGGVGGSKPKPKQKDTTSTKPKTNSSATKTPKKEAYTPASKTSRQGNIGRTTTKYDTLPGRARIEDLPSDKKEKKVSPGVSQMGHNAYQNLSFNRRK